MGSSVIGVVEIKRKYFLVNLVLFSLPSCRQRMLLFPVIVRSKSCLLDSTFPTTTLRSRHLTTDKPEVKPASEPESLHSCVIS